MKRLCSSLLAALLAFLLCLSASAAETAPPKVREYPGFPDVPAESWCAGAVKLCYEAGLINGTSDDSFSPDAPVTAAKAVVLAARAESLLHGTSIETLPDEDDRVQFLDAAGNPVATFENWEGVSSVPGESPDICLYFDAETTRRLAGTPMVLVLDGYRYSTGSYRASVDGRAGWVFPLTDEEFYDRDPFGILVDISSSDFSDIWFALELFHLASLEPDRLMAWLDTAPAFSGDGTLPDRTAATREEFFFLLDMVLTPEDLPALRTGVSVPDSDDPAVLRFYQAGILNGVDETGRFDPEGTLTRGQAAAILARVLDPSLRLK